MAWKQEVLCIYSVVINLRKIQLGCEWKWTFEAYSQCCKCYNIQEANPLELQLLIRTPEHKFRTIWVPDVTSEHQDVIGYCPRDYHKKIGPHRIRYGSDQVLVPRTRFYLKVLVCSWQCVNWSPLAQRMLPYDVELLSRLPVLLLKVRVAAHSVRKCSRWVPSLSTE